ncbi:ABC transporter permease [Nocardiopsis sp. CC223A]|uniref:ABC transporter permease n=1 Tax=Nocardiopsis sp. CC223A TaxID=3044051 RepID=UPI00278C855F|nr:ABC transporter permease [Nocardiopsis sp. CC223A]
MTVDLTAVRGRSFRARRPWGLWAAVAFLAAAALAGLCAPLVAPQAPGATDLMNSLAPPGTPGHPLGTDSTGRDVLSRVLYGARLSLLAPLGVVLLASLLGITLGLTAARLGGWADIVVSRGMDVVFAFPGLLLAMLVVAVFGPGVVAPVCALAVSYTPFIGRLVRNAAVQEGARPYPEAYRVMGFGGLWVTVRHLLPNIAPMLIAQGTLSFGYALVDLAALSYLGLGVRPPAADWGSMISQSQSAILQGAPWGALVPGLAVLGTVVSLIVVGGHIGGSIVKKGERT